MMTPHCFLSSPKISNLSNNISMRSSITNAPLRPLPMANLLFNHVKEDLVIRITKVSHHFSTITPSLSPHKTDEICNRSLHLPNTLHQYTRSTPSSSLYSILLYSKFPLLFTHTIIYSYILTQFYAPSTYSDQAEIVDFPIVKTLTPLMMILSTYWVMFETIATIVIVVFQEEIVDITTKTITMNTIDGIIKDKGIINLVEMDIATMIDQRHHLVRDLRRGPLGIIPYSLSTRFEPHCLFFHQYPIPTIHKRIICLSYTLTLFYPDVVERRLDEHGVPALEPSHIPRIIPLIPHHHHHQHQHHPPPPRKTAKAVPVPVPVPIC